MNVQEVQAEGLARVLKITVPQSALQEKMEARLAAMKDNATLKGFRPGKVPVAHLRKQYGAQVMGEIVQAEVAAQSQAALEGRNERAAMQPEIAVAGDVEKIMQGESDLTFDIKYEIVPDIKLMDFSTIALEKPTLEVDEDAVEDALKRLAEADADNPKEIDDALAQSMGLENLDALRDAVRNQITLEYAQLARGALKSSLLDALETGHDFALPAGMVKLEFDQLWQEFERDLKQQEKTLEDMDEDEAEIRDTHQKLAERRVRTGLVLAEIGEKNEITVSQEEMNNGLAQHVRQYPGQEQQVIEFFRNNPNALSQIRAPIFEEKVVDFICEMATLTEKPVTLEELLDAPEETKPAKKTTPKKKTTKKAK